MSYQKNYPNGWQSGEAGGTPVTPEALDNIEAGIANALPKDGSDPMTGNLQMDGHRVTGLGNPKDNNDALSLRYARGNFFPAVESADFPGCYYMSRNNIVEWINPPMMPGVEYRTTERHNGKVVYRMRILYTNEATIGNTSGVTNTLIGHRISNFETLLRVGARQTGSVLPYITSSGGLAMVSTVSATNIILSIKDSIWSSREWDFDIVYTKTT